MRNGPNQKGIESLGMRKRKASFGRKNETGRRISTAVSREQSLGREKGAAARVRTVQENQARMERAGGRRTKKKIVPPRKAGLLKEARTCSKRRAEDGKGDLCGKPCHVPTKKNTMSGARLHSFIAK